MLSSHKSTHNFFVQNHSVQVETFPSWDNEKDRPNLSGKTVNQFLEKRSKISAHIHARESGPSNLFVF